MQEDRAGDDREKRLKAHQKRHYRRVAVFLRDDLAGVAHAACKNTDVQDVRQALLDLCQRGLLARDQRADARENANRDELDARKLDAVHLLAEVVDDHDVERERDGAEEDIKIAALKRKALAAGEAEEIKPRHRKRHIEPHALARLFADKQPEHRHEHDVERRDKSRLARARLLHTVLLEVDGRGKHHAAGNAADQQRLFLLARIFFARMQAARNAHQHKKEDRRGDHAQHAERKRADLAGAQALRHK